MIRRFSHGLSPVGHRCEEKLRWTWREITGQQKSSSCSKPWLGRTAAARILHRCRCWRRGPGCTTGRMKAGCSESSMWFLPVWKTSIGCPLSKMQGVYATCCWNQLYFGTMFWAIVDEKKSFLLGIPPHVISLDVRNVVLLGTSSHWFSMVFCCLWLQAIRCNHEMYPNRNAMHILTTFSGFVDEVPMWKWNSGAIWRYWSDQIGIHSSAATNEALWESSKRYFAERGNLFHGFTFLGQTTTRTLPMWSFWGIQANLWLSRHACSGTGREQYCLVIMCYI